MNANGNVIMNVGEVRMNKKVRFPRRPLKNVEMVALNRFGFQHANNAEMLSEKELKRIVKNFRRQNPQLVFPEGGARRKTMKKHPKKKRFTRKH